MFSVKVTYHGEIRRFSFSNSTTFPTYEQLYTQVCIVPHYLYQKRAAQVVSTTLQLTRVFPSNNLYYLNKLLFFPDASQPGRILIGSQVRNAEEYDKCIVPFRGRTWLNASLRFALVDVNTSMGPGSFIGPTVGHFPGAGSYDEVLASHPTSNPRPLFVPRSPVTFDSEVPPRAFSPIPLESGALMDMSIDDSSARSLSSSCGFTPSSRTTDAAALCCPTAQVKQDVESLLKAFQRDLYQAMGRLSESTALDFDRSSVNATPRSSFSSFICSSCKKSVSRQWFICLDCSAVACSNCNLYNTTCPVSGVRHALSASGLPGLSTFAQCQVPAATETTELSVNSPFIPPGSMSLSLTNSISTSCTPSPSPVIHSGIICDSCNLIIEGVRHKCLDCPDYDLCTTCIAHGAHERHNFRHQLLDITEPGRVIVHTVKEPEGREDCILTSTSDQHQSPLVVHHATCDLCDSIIEGHRYKCAVCPDFDTCESCFAITEEQHPRHSFVRISKKEDYIPRGSSFTRRHFARCDVCDITIVGIRYKCMHPDCPDFDLCEKCEALPIPQHPDTHPLLKMKSVDTTIPTVLRSPDVTYFSPHKTVRSHSPLADSVSSESRLPSMWPLNSFSESSLLESPPILPALDPKESAPGAPIDSISCSMYPLSDALPPIDSRPQSRSNSLIQEEVTTPGRLVKPSSPVCEVADYSIDCVKTSMLPSSSPTAALLECNDTPAVPGSWYGPGLNSLVNGAADEHHTSHSVLTQTPRQSGLTRSPLHHEALPNGLPTPHSIIETSNVYHPSLVELTRHCSLSKLSREDQAVKETLDSSEVPLSAGYIEDVTAPDGQVFSAGVTFIKVWRMVNNGSRDWPADTEVVFVGGAQLSNGNPLSHTQAMYSVGPLKSGEEKTVWTPELRAPDVPGRYTSYWRLRDDKGQLFGSSIWVDIEVVDPSQSEELVTSSSMIIMPDPTSPASPAVDERAISRSPTEESFDDRFSDSSSVSIVSVPSSEDEADTILWEESRAQGRATSTGTLDQSDHVAEHASTAMDYVLLYDDNTSEEE